MMKWKIEEVKIKTKIYGVMWKMTQKLKDNAAVHL